MTVFTVTAPFWYAPYTPSFSRVAPSTSEIVNGIVRTNKREDKETRLQRPNYRFVSNTEDVQTVEIELPGVKKSDIDISVDRVNRTLRVTGKRFENVKSIHTGETNDKEEMKDDKVENVDKKAERKEKKEDIEERKACVVYKWDGCVHERADLSEVEAEYVGEGILRVVLKRREESGPTRIEIKEA